VSTPSSGARRRERSSNGDSPLEVPEFIPRG
jgi:hypothetical protein